MAIGTIELNRPSVRVVGEAEVIFYKRKLWGLMGVSRGEIEKPQQVQHQHNGKAFCRGDVEKKRFVVPRSGKRGRVVAGARQVG